MFSRQLFSFAAGLALVALAGFSNSCQSSRYREDERPEDVVKLVVQFSPALFAPQTKAVKDGWESGDVVFIFFEGITKGYMRMTWNGSSWSHALESYSSHDPFVPMDLAASGKRLTAVHLPFVQHADVSLEEGQFVFLDPSPHKSGLSTWFCKAESVPYLTKVSDSSLLLGLPASVSPDNRLMLSVEQDQVQFFLPDASWHVGTLPPESMPLLSVSRLSDGAAAVSAVQIKSVAPGGAVTSTTSDQALSCVVYKKEGQTSGLLFSGVARYPGVPEQYHLRVTFPSPGGPIHNLELGSMYIETTEMTMVASSQSGRAWRLPEPSSTSWRCDQPGKVDFGQGIQWAECNLGSENTLHSGLYLSWGEIAPKPAYLWTAYRWASGNSPTKYYSGDGLGVLEVSDDAARIRLGGKWRMPTLAEWEDFVGRVSFSAVGTSFAFVATSTSDASKSIVFPRRNALGADDGVTYILGQHAAYWTADLRPSGALTDPSSAHPAMITFESNNSTTVIFLSSQAESRASGLNIRPVWDESLPDIQTQAVTLQDITGMFQDVTDTAGDGNFNPVWNIM